MSITNVSKPTNTITWANDSNTWANETRSWLKTLTLITNIAKT